MVNNLRLLLLFTLFAVCAASSTAWFAYAVARRSLEDSARTNLTLSREQKKRKVETFFSQLREQIVFDAHSITERDGLTRDAFTKPAPRHLGVESRLFLGCSNLMVKLSEAVRQTARELCLNSSIKAPSLVDFSSDEGDVAAYLALRVDASQKMLDSAVLVYKVPMSSLERLMLPAENWFQEGFGRTGETYIVGSDSLMRTNSRFAVEDLNGLLSILQSKKLPHATMEKIRRTGSTVLALSVRTDATKAALAGKTETAVLRDYRDQVVLSSYTPLRVPGVQWVLLSEVDLEEAMAAVSDLRGTLLLCTGILALLFLLVGSFLSRSIAAPLDKLARNALEMSEALQLRIGHDLHDNLAQKIVGIAFLAKASQKEALRCDSTSAAAFQRLASLADDAANTARELSRGLSPVPVLQNGILDAIKALASDTEARFPGVAVDVVGSGVAHSLPEESSLHLYRIAQEAISNAVRHGKASSIRIEFSFENERGDLSVRNNGLPLSESGSSAGIGLAVMAMRSRAMGGAFSLTELRDGWIEVRCQFRMTKEHA